MNLDIANLPSLNLNNSSDPEIKRLKSYLFQLSQQMTFILDNIDDENFNVVYKEKMDRAINVSQASKNLAETLQQGLNSSNEKVKKKFEELAQNIIDTATEITKNFESQILQSDEQIISKVQEDYIAKSDKASMESEIVSQATQTSKDFVLEFINNSKFLTDDEEGSTQEFINNQRSYTKFTEDGIELGKSDSPFKLLITNTMMAFTYNGVPVGYISVDSQGNFENKIYFNNIEVYNRFTLGNSNDGFFDFIHRANGNMSIVFRE